MWLLRGRKLFVKIFPYCNKLSRGSITLLVQEHMHTLSGQTRWGLGWSAFICIYYPVCVTNIHIPWDRERWVMVGLFPGMPPWYTSREAGWRAFFFFFFLHTKLAVYFYKTIYDFSHFPRALIFQPGWQHMALLCAEWSSLCQQGLCSLPAFYKTKISKDLSWKGQEKFWW